MCARRAGNTQPARFRACVVATMLAVTGCVHNPLRPDGIRSGTTPITGCREVKPALVTSAVSVADRRAIADWGREVGARGWSYFECRGVTEQQGTVLCLFSHSYLMQEVFGAVTLNVEGRRDGDDGARRLLGVDLRVSDLTAFAVDACRQCSTPIEREFFGMVLPQLEHRFAAKAVIATAWGNTATIEHELLHGEYFVNDDYRSAVHTFWSTELSDDQRAVISRELGAEYDATNSDLIVNEFQAYLLQAKPSSMLAAQRHHLRPRLLRYLRGAGVLSSFVLNE